MFIEEKLLKKSGTNNGAHSFCNIIWVMLWNNARESMPLIMLGSRDDSHCVRSLTLLIARLFRTVFGLVRVYLYYYSFNGCSVEKSYLLCRAEKWETPLTRLCSQCLLVHVINSQEIEWGQVWQALEEADSRNSGKNMIHIVTACSYLKKNKVHSY